MINLFFKKKEANASIVIEVTGVDEAAVCEKALKDADRAYNTEVVAKLFEDLCTRYSIGPGLWCADITFARDHRLLNALIIDMAGSLDLLRPVDKDDT